MLTEKSSDPSSVPPTTIPIRPHAGTRISHSPEKQSPIIKNPVLTMVFLDFLALFIYIGTTVHIKAKYEDSLKEQHEID